MQEITHLDGSVVRSYFNDTKEAHEKAEKMVRDNVDQIKQVRRVYHIGRNEKCPCGSGKKFKKCCIKKVEQDGSLNT